MELRTGDFVKLSNTKAKRHSVGTWMVSEVHGENNYILTRIKRNGEVQRGKIFFLDKNTISYVKVRIVKGNEYMKDGVICHFRWVADVYKQTIKDAPAPEKCRDIIEGWQKKVEDNLVVVERLIEKYNKSAA